MWFSKKSITSERPFRLNRSCNCNANWGASLKGQYDYDFALWKAYAALLLTLVQVDWQVLQCRPYCYLVENRLCYAKMASKVSTVSLPCLVSHVYEGGSMLKRPLQFCALHICSTSSGNVLWFRRFFSHFTIRIQRKKLLTYRTTFHAK